MSKKAEYEQLKKTWYAKIRNEGFKDIEHADGSINSCSPARSTRNQTPDLRQAIQDYYCMATYFLNEHKFDRELDKVIWEYHTEGLAIKEIVKLLKQVEIKIKVKKTKRIKVQKIDHNVVWKTLKKLETIMKNLYLSV